MGERGRAVICFYFSENDIRISVPTADHVPASDRRLLAEIDQKQQRALIGCWFCCLNLNLFFPRSSFFLPPCSSLCPSSPFSSCDLQLSLHLPIQPIYALYSPFSSCVYLFCSSSSRNRPRRHPRSKNITTAFKRATSGRIFSLAYKHKNIQSSTSSSLFSLDYLRSLTPHSALCCRPCV